MKKIPKGYSGKWILLNRNNEVIFSSDNVADVVKKGWEFPKDEVTIQKNLPRGTCFF